MRNLFKESLIIYIWDCGRFRDSNLRTKDGRSIEILDRGHYADEPGADFKGAKIRLDGKIYVGSVEVHVTSSDWYKHGHDSDPSYNDTILHVAFWDDTDNLLTRKQNNENIPILILSNHLDNSIIGIIRTASSGPCLVGKDLMPTDLLKDMLKQFGMFRFLQKASMFNNMMNTEDPNQVLYEGIMDALGYLQNRRQFKSLARRVPYALLFGQPEDSVQAMLFGVSGLLPKAIDVHDDETRKYVGHLNSLWDRLSSQFKGKTMERKNWNLFRVRQSNFPTLRLAGMSRIISSSDQPIADAVSSIFNRDKEGGLIKFLTLRADGYWKHHYDFEKRSDNKSLIGENRASDIIVNVVLPFIYARSKRVDDRVTMKTVKETYSKYGKLQDNKIFRHFSSISSLANSAISQQGLIHIYRTFCVKRNCQNCPIIVGDERNKFEGLC